MNDPNPAPGGPEAPAAKSPFAHRATRAPFMAEKPASAGEPLIEAVFEVMPPPVVKQPEPARAKKFPVWVPVVLGVAAIAAGTVLLYPKTGGQSDSAKSSAASPAPELSPADRLAAGEKRLVAALALARRYGCEKTSPEAFSKIGSRTSDASAAKSAGKTEAAAGHFEAAASAAEQLVAVAAQAACSAAIAATGLPDLRDYAREAGSALGERIAAGEAALSLKNFEAAAREFDLANASVPAVALAAKSRLESLAAEAQAGGATAQAGVFFKKLVALDPQNAGAVDWLMRRGVRAGAPLRSPKLGLALAYAPPGQFTEGSPDAEPGRDADEVRRTVTLAKGFWMGLTEITQAQWDAVMGRGAAAVKLKKERPGFVGADLPMSCVTWGEATEFCRRLSEIEGFRFRLPTEAEWEYACRAGVNAPYSTGKMFLAPGEAVVDDSTAGAPDAPRVVTAPGAPVNAWGLRDMHGNVWEWCSDWYAPWGRDPATNPAGVEDRAAGPADQAMKVARGGSWNDPAAAARSANRWQYAPAAAVNYIGLRVVMEFTPRLLPE